MTRAMRDGLAFAAAVLAAASLLHAFRFVADDALSTQATRARLAELDRLLPRASYDNDPISDTIHVRAPAWLGSDDALEILRARRGNVPVALILDLVAPDGYGGPIRLQVAVQADGRIVGLRVLEQHETPGLGAQIAQSDDDWLARLHGRSLQDPAREHWRSRADGGDIDQIAGATITSRTLLDALRRALEYHARHGSELFDAPAGTRLEHLDAPLP